MTLPEPIISTARLELRPFVDDDLDGLAAMYGDSRTMRYIADLPLTREQSREALEGMRSRLAERGYGLMAAVSRETGELVGRCGFHVWSIELRDEVEIGWLIRRDCWGRGYATEIGASLRDYGFEMLGLHRLISVIDPANAASIRVAEKLGETLWKEIEHRGKRVLVYSVERP